MHLTLYGPEKRLGLRLDASGIEDGHRNPDPSAAGSELAEQRRLADSPRPMGEQDAERQ
jgi:hypothetical protein